MVHMTVNLSQIMIGGDYMVNNLKHQWFFERGQFETYQAWLKTINKDMLACEVKRCGLCNTDVMQYSLALQPFPINYAFDVVDNESTWICQLCIHSIFVCDSLNNKPTNGCFIYLPEVSQAKLNFFINWLQHGDDLSVLDKKSFYAELKACQSRWLDVCGVDISDPFYFKLFYQQHMDTTKHWFDKTCFLPNVGCD